MIAPTQSHRLWSKMIRRFTDILTNPPSPRHIPKQGQRWKNAGQVRTSSVECWAGQDIDTSLSLCMQLVGDEPVIIYCKPLSTTCLMASSTVNL